MSLMFCNTIAVKWLYCKLDSIITIKTASSTVQVILNVKPLSQVIVFNLSFDEFKVYSWYCIW